LSDDAKSIWKDIVTVSKFGLSVVGLLASIGIFTWNTFGWDCSIFNWKDYTGKNLGKKPGLKSPN